MDPLTQAQQIFSVFYAIFFGIMLQTIGAHRANVNKLSNKDKPEATLNLFDTPNAWVIGRSFKNKPLFRFLFSIVFLNILPALVFALVFTGLSEVKEKLNILQIVVIVAISLLPHYIYRIYLGTLLFLKDNLFLNSEDSKIYSKADIDASSLLGNDRISRKDAHQFTRNHLAIPVYWIFPLIIVLYDIFLASDQISDIFMHFSYFLILFGLVDFLSRKKID